MKALEKLCALENPFVPPKETEELFLETLRESFANQRKLHPFLREMDAARQADPSAITSLEEAFRIPPLYVGTLKIHDFLSVPPEEVVLTLTSSGTSGQKTKLHFDAPSLQRMEALSQHIFKALGYYSEEPAHYLLFSYDREEASAIGTSWSTEQKMACAPSKSVHWLLKRDEKGSFSFDLPSTARLIIDLASDGPLRFLGFPAFMHTALREAKRLHPSLNVDPESFVIAGGGWKNHAGEPMKQGDFAQFVEESCGLPRANVRDIFGMAEHGVPYGACPLGHHHVPACSRLAVLDPLTLEPLGFDREGQLLLLSPWNSAQPNQSILSTDVAILKENCPCGLPGTYIASIRRGGTQKHKGCAIAAQEILDRMGKTS
ncbi:MAG TPA: acyl-protein synthetase LuxE [Synergistaceae bacterium]|nr:acyl-protein synthetase LuxE [Synergistaceae bacterium]HPJ25569.1 acyl-protein synthetase LuxE [Synergistaceae bacterium]HPQ36494.1 acyl-protein synthetase LuxE [Synergistaceae bacterium]